MSGGVQLEQAGGGITPLGGLGTAALMSLINSYLVMREECNATICDGTTAVPIGGGSIGDTHIIGIIILKNAGPATATVAGLLKKNTALTEAAQSIVFTGSTADDRYIDLKGSINAGAACTVTASVDETVIVLWRPV